MADRSRGTDWINETAYQLISHKRRFSPIWLVPVFLGLRENRGRGRLGECEVPEKAHLLRNRKAGPTRIL